MPIVPRPAEMRPRPGRFVLSSDARIGASGAAVPAAWLLHDALRGGAGLTVPVVDAGDPAATVRLRVEDSQGAHPEGYTLDVTEDGVDVIAATVAGLTRGVQAFRQLLPAETLRAAPVLAEPPAAPCCVIRDAPRYDWRGLHLDVARHWMPKQFLLRMIDVAALHRLNVVHLHLTDDQGWRFDVPGWPRLVEIGGWREQTLVGHAHEPRGYDGTPHGGYFTAGDLREIAAYAARRHVTVVPEVDFPGHMRAALAAYPELGCTGHTYDVGTTWGIFDQVLAPSEEAVRFGHDVVDTLCDIFPGPYVHVGGDECPRTEWRASAYARERADELGLSSVDELQSWFLRELAGHAADRGRRAAAWDEAVEDGGMPKDTVIMGWQAAEHGSGALDAGYDIVMCPQEGTYLDHYQSEGADEPLALGGLTTLDDVIDFDPAAGDGGTGDRGTGAGRLLGVQAQLWTEYLPTPRHVEYAAFPRLAAFAEAGWTPRERRDGAELRERIAGHLDRLAALGLNYRPLDGPRPWQRGGTGARRRHYPDRSG